jgi:hypothetical protein
MRTRLRPNRWEYSLAAGWWRPVSALPAVSRDGRLMSNAGGTRSHGSTKRQTHFGIRTEVERLKPFGGLRCRRENRFRPRTGRRGRRSKHSQPPVARSLVESHENWLGVRDDFRTWFVENAAELWRSGRTASVVRGLLNIDQPLGHRRFLRNRSVFHGIVDRSR